MDSRYLKSAAGGVGGAAIGSWLGGYKNPMDKAMPYFEQMPGELEKYMGYYNRAGNKAGNILQGEYGGILANPGGKINEIGANFQQSPGFQFALQQALQGARNTASAGGMYGSPQHEQQAMAIATNLGNQEYNNWLKQALGLYGAGLEGEQNIYGIGAKTGMAMGEDMASILANEAKLAYEAEAAENQRKNDIFGAIGGAAGSLAAFL